MRVSIQFCAECDYEPRALELAAEVRKAYPDAEIDLVPAGDGKFDVKCDDVDVFEKLKKGRFPGPGEVLGLLAREKPGAER